MTFTATDLGVLQTADRWASFTARGRTGDGSVHSALVIVDEQPPFANDKQGAVLISIDAMEGREILGSLPSVQIRIRTAAPAAPARRRE